MESRIEALNELKGIGVRLFETHKLSMEILNETITGSEELEQYRKDIASNKHLIQEKRCTVSQLEKRSQLLDKQTINLEAILKEKKQCAQDQADLLKKDQYDILSARSSYCDHVYKFIEENEKKKISLISSEDNNLTEMDDICKQVENLENKLKELNERISVHQSTLKELQSVENTQREEEFRYQQILNNKRETLKNLKEQRLNLQEKELRQQNELNLQEKELRQQNELNLQEKELCQQNELNLQEKELRQQNETENLFRDERLDQQGEKLCQQNESENSSGEQQRDQQEEELSERNESEKLFRFHCKNCRAPFRAVFGEGGLRQHEKACCTKWKKNQHRCLICKKIYQKRNAFNFHLKNAHKKST